MIDIRVVIIITVDPKGEIQNSIIETKIFLKLERNLLCSECMASRFIPVRSRFQERRVLSNVRSPEDFISSTKVETVRFFFSGTAQDPRRHFQRPARRSSGELRLLVTVRPVISDDDGYLSNRRRWNIGTGGRRRRFDCFGQREHEPGTAVVRPAYSRRRRAAVRVRWWCWELQRQQQRRFRRRERPGQAVRVRCGRLARSAFCRVELWRLCKYHCTRAGIVTFESFLIVTSSHFCTIVWFWTWHDRFLKSFNPMPPFSNPVVHRCRYWS